MGEPGGQSLGGQQAGPTEAGGENGGVIEQRAGVENLKHLGVRVTETVTSRRAERVEDPGESASSAAVQGLEQPPVPSRR